MVRRMLVAALIGSVLTSCEVPTAPLPEGAVPYAPYPPQMSFWWQQVEECSGLRGDLSQVRFYIVPNASTFQWQGQEVIGLWIQRGNRIVLASEYAFRANNVRHEMLHALTRIAGHPTEYFVDRCGGLVDYTPDPAG
jgi:hypothetical protein